MRGPSWRPSTTSSSIGSGALATAACARRGATAPTAEVPAAAPIVARTGSRKRTAGGMTSVVDRQLMGRALIGRTVDACEADRRQLSRPNVELRQQLLPIG